MDLMYLDQDYGGAICQFRKALDKIAEKESSSVILKSEPKTGDLHNMIAHACFQMGDYDQALGELEMALTIAKGMATRNDVSEFDEGWIYYRMGKCFHEKRDYEAAAKCTEMAGAIFGAASPSKQKPTAMSKLRQAIAISKGRRAHKYHQRYLSETTGPTEAQFSSRRKIDGACPPSSIFINPEGPATETSIRDSLA